MISEMDKKIIGEIINLYNENTKFKEKLNNLYNTNPAKLKLIELYTLEDIIRYGDKSYYNRLMKLGINEEAIRKEYNDFLDKCINDKKYELSKMRDYKNNRKSLTPVETFAINLILKDNEKKYDYKYIDYDYDDYIELKYSNDKEIRESVSNVFFANLIGSLFEKNVDPILRNELKPIIEHQKHPGLIASVDKPKMLDFLRELISYDYKGVTEGIDTMFNQAKFYLACGFQEKTFDFFSKHRSNISAREVFDIKPKQKIK